MQLLLPGETAPAHRHTPSAARIIIEGEGGYTVVNGETYKYIIGQINALESVRQEISNLQQDEGAKNENSLADQLDHFRL